MIINPKHQEIIKKNYLLCNLNVILDNGIVFFYEIIFNQNSLAKIIDFEQIHFECK